MRVVAIATVKNESDIIEPFVRHTLALVDHLVLLDNASTDGTSDVLRSLTKEGLPLTIIDEPSPGKYQSQRMTYLMREHAVRVHGADWILPLDADEFLVTNGGDSWIPATNTDDRPLELSWRTYVPDDRDELSQINLVVRIRQRLVQEAHPWAKVLVPRKLAAVCNSTLKQGNHEVLIGDRPCPATGCSSASIAHFPIRSPGQYLAKVAVTALQYHAMPDRDIDWGWHYRSPFEKLKEDPEAFRASYHTAARWYAVPPGTRFAPHTVDDPISYRGGPLRYTKGVDDADRGLVAVLCHAEELARKYAVVTSNMQPADHEALASQETSYVRLISQLVSQDDLIRSLQTEFDQLQQRLAHQQRLLQDPAYRAEHVVRAFHQSWTWKAGRITIGPLGYGKRFFNWLIRGDGLEKWINKP